MQMLNVDRFALIVIGKAAEIGHELIARLRARFFERRQRRLRLSDERLFRHHVGRAHGAELEALLQYVELLLIGGDEIARDLDLRGVGGIGDRGGHDIGGQRQIGRLKLESLILGRGEIALNRAHRLAEDVGRERHGDIRIMERVE